ncbi:hypothetical protein FB451DRAFT_1240069 [Mycena latifolia]|nr:hypothetical protein FB451DRAFT_1240069 [Mycena latifolia]
MRWLFPPMNIFVCLSTPFDMLGSSFFRLFTLALLCATVRAGQTNYTIDDGAQAVVYSQTPVLQCTTSTCPESWTNQLFNRTSTLTESPIIVGFTGNAIYAYLTLAGACIFNIDGVDVGVFNNTAPVSPGNIQLAYHNASIPDGDHILLISPAQADMVIEFDYVIHTVFSADRKSSTLAGMRAIISGVIIGAALVAGIITATYFWRRRDKQRKLFLRGIPLGDGDETSIKMATIATKK